MQYNMIEKIMIQKNIHHWWIGFDWKYTTFNDCNFGGILYYIELWVHIIPCVAIYILIGPNCFKMQRKGKIRKDCFLIYQKKPPKNLV